MGKREKAVRVPAVIEAVMALDAGPRWKLIRTLGDHHVDTAVGGYQRDRARMAEAWHTLCAVRNRGPSQGSVPMRVEDLAAKMQWRQRRELLRALVWADGRRVASRLPAGLPCPRTRLRAAVSRFRSAEEGWHRGRAELERIEALKAPAQGGRRG